MPISYYLREQAPDYNFWLESIVKSEEVQFLEAFLDHGFREKRQITPNKQKIFRPLSLTSLKNIRVVILGIEPYMRLELNDGLAFSTPRIFDTNPTLMNIFRCLYDDLGKERRDNDLSSWAEQGVLLWNMTPTLELGLIEHSNKGWNHITNGLISLIDSHQPGVAWCLWGNQAQEKKKFIKHKYSTVIESSSPSPLSAHLGFKTHKPFSQINSFLERSRFKPITFF